MTDAVNASLVGSIQQRKIVRIDKKGNPEDFWMPAPVPAPDMQWGQQQLPVLGEVRALGIDAAHRSLWACATGWGPQGKRSGIWEFDSQSGFLRQLGFVNDTAQHLLNALAVSSKGVAYATDLKTGAIYRLRTNQPPEEELEAWLPAGTFAAPSGICLSDDNRTLYVADTRGIFSVNLTSKQMMPVSATETLDLNQLKSLSYYKGALISIQDNGAPRILRFQLDASRQRITGTQILETTRSETSAGPASGIVVGDDFYYIANSHQSVVIKPGEAPALPAAEVAEPIVIRLSLL
ncbi:SMP-30/gluconolactonase/LRE family protein [Hymenobacter sp. DG25A]|uniref:SMP-30/gluconolactonase/LRE family protein n=1 Tax=Hymenobacter sp. DG25A TaxID=1385663 RepID=UPI0006BCC268|nr:hypothetical protein [Hymenobacter sp. DG25A]ALD22074.1 hypothetical protein AM218_13700 [Hymenobacter sp. DG25A]